ncbi:MAG: M23 family metallopeptidase, partial [Acidimicrobiales bacterium]
MSRSRSFLVLLLLALIAGLVLPADAETVIYRPPVDAPVVDGFRLPNGPYGAGNRGLEYDTVPGQAVRAIGDGLVVFAGPVAGIGYVTVLHPDGLRSSYGHLADLLVAAGERIVIGQVVGTAGERLHLGVRSGGT